MKQQVVNPRTGIYPATPDYVHGLGISSPERVLYVAGTMGLDEHGRAPDTLDGQLKLVWRNIRRILAAAGMTPDNIVRVTSYLADVAHAPANQQARTEALGERVVPTTAIVTGLLSDDWMVEIEVIAAA